MSANWPPRLAVISQKFVRGRHWPETAPLVQQPRLPDAGASHTFRRCGTGLGRGRARAGRRDRAGGAAGVAATAGAELVAGAVRPARVRDFAPALPSWAGRIDAP